VGGLFNLGTCCAEAFKFHVVHLSILSLSWWAIGILLRNSSAIPITSRVFHVLSYINFRDPGLILTFLFHFELILVKSDRHGSGFSFLPQKTTFPSNSC
jgi:hypothetical protein